MQDTIARIDRAIAELEKRAAADPVFAQDAEYAEAMTTEGGKKRLMEARRTKLEQEIQRLESV